MAIAIIAVVIILAAIGIHSCQVSQRNSSLKDYSDNVASLNQRSDATGSSLFSTLRGGSSSNQVALQNEVAQVRLSAMKELQNAQSMNVPSEVSSAQTYLVLALRMRLDAITNIAGEIGSAFGNTTRADAVGRIASEMARFYASDVVYKDYTLPQMISALRSAGIAVGPPNGQQIDYGQFLNNLEWLTPSGVSSLLHVSLPAASTPAVKAAPGIHGHRMDSVSVGGTTLTPGGSATIPASPPPTFTCTFDNDGQNIEHNVIVKVTVHGTSISGQATVAQTNPGQTYTAQVTLNNSPPAGTYTVTATIERVPGETVVTHNTQTFNVTFQ